MKLDDRVLMLFHDGELDAERARRVRAAVLSDGGLARRLDALTQLGDFVRAFAESRSDELARARRAEARVRNARRVSTGVAVGLCVAALFALWLRPSALAPEARSGSEPKVAVFAFAAAQSPAVRVESIDFGARDGAIFVMAAGPGEAVASDTTVVWLGDETPASGVGTL